MGRVFTQREDDRIVPVTVLSYQATYELLGLGDPMQIEAPRLSAGMFPVLAVPPFRNWEVPWVMFTWARAPIFGAPCVAWFSNRRSSTSHEVKDDWNDGQYKENVNKERRDVEHEKASKPQQKQHESNR
jgi:hypothetical protein